MTFSRQPSSNNNNHKPMTIIKNNVVFDEKFSMCFFFFLKCVFELRPVMDDDRDLCLTLAALRYADVCVISMVMMLWEILSMFEPFVSCFASSSSSHHYDYGRCLR
jgi:uncharacterized membrane protein YqhA